MKLVIPIPSSLIPSNLKKTSTDERFIVMTPLPERDIWNTAAEATSEIVIERIRHVHDERGNYIAISIR